MNSQRNDALGPWLALFCVPQLSLKLTHQLLNHFQTAAAVLAASEQALREFRVKPQAIKAMRDYQQQPPTSGIATAIHSTLAWLDAAADHHIIHWAHPGYPDRLREIAQPPLLLFVAGNPQLLSCPQLAFVGSRHPSVDGKQLAYDFASQLSRSGLLVTSGLALGIDGASHAGALAAAAPTIAVMATGMDKIYPRRNQQLAQQIRQTGALVSEFPLGHQPLPSSFPQRNRIISGLSLGVLVVEAAIKSGSLITARCALEQNREVFAIPGSIHNPVAKGCHLLIKQGAKLVESGQDILEELALSIAPVEPVEPATAAAEAPTSVFDEQQHRVLKQLGFDAVSMDMLVERTGLAVTDLSAILAQLTLLGQVENTERGFVRVFEAGV